MAGADSGMFKDCEEATGDVKQTKEEGCSFMTLNCVSAHQHSIPGSATDFLCDLGKSLNFSVLLFPHLQNGENIFSFFVCFVYLNYQLSGA